jgi:thiamine biosynthesis lipoprotein
MTGTLPLVVLLVASVSFPVAEDHASATVERSAWAMGTRISVTVEAGDRGSAVNASEAALRAVAKVEARLSTWVDDSELSHLNRADPETGFAVSPELESDLREASHWWKETRGSFDPGIRSLVEAWDLRGGGREPSAVELKLARAAAGFGHLALDLGIARVDVAGFGIEEGGFGKGIALRQAAEAARAAGADCAVLDFGGQIEIDGDCGKVRVEIADPDRRDHSIARLTMGTGSVATSGNSERVLLVNGVRRGHLLDPRSGRPVPDWGAVTVVASDPVAADCLSTALYVMGPRKGAEWLSERPDIEAIFAEIEGGTVRLITTPGLKDRLEVFEANLQFLFLDQKVVKELTR